MLVGYVQQPHLLKKLCVAHYACSVTKFSACLVQSHHGTHNGALHYLGELTNLCKGRPTRPLVHHLFDDAI